MIKRPITYLPQPEQVPKLSLVLTPITEIESCWLTARAAVARRGTGAATVASHCEGSLVGSLEKVWERYCLFVVRMKKKECLWSGSCRVLYRHAAFVRLSSAGPSLYNWGVLECDLVGDLSFCCGVYVSDFGGWLRASEARVMIHDGWFEIRDRDRDGISR